MVYHHPVFELLNDVLLTFSSVRIACHVSPFILTIFLGVCRSLVEDDDAHMKVSLGCGDMGLSAHLQASKTGNTRFFTSNTHSSVVLQVSDCVCLLPFVSKVLLHWSLFREPQILQHSLVCFVCLPYLIKPLFFLHVAECFSGITVSFSSN